MPPGLSSRLSFQKRQRQARTVLSECKVTKSREQNKENRFFFLQRQSNFAISDGKVTKNWVQNKIKSFIFVLRGGNYASE